MRKVSGSLRLDLAQYRALVAFSQFGSDLDKATQQQLHRGVRLVEILKQPQYRPLSVAKQVAIIFAGTRGLLDDVEVADIGKWETEFYTFLEEKRPGILSAITDQKDISKDLEAELTDAITEFSKGFAARVTKTAGVA
jgi:F-type H+-transporting ATPase subunit alpha